jgi:DNA-binding NarL/FixJ family response regulator
VKILLVDDHAILRDGLKRVLSDEFSGLVLGEAASADEALALLATDRWDLILLDISMPGRSGLDLLPQLRSDYPLTRIIVLSSFGDKQFVIRALRDGASAFLTKERAARELLSAVRTVLAGRRYIASDMAELLVSLVARDEPQNPHDALSTREFEVFRLIAMAHSPAEIAAQLEISAKTVSTYRARILEKMGLSTNAELMQYAIRHGLVS